MSKTTTRRPVERFVSAIHTRPSVASVRPTAAGSNTVKLRITDTTDTPPHHALGRVDGDHIYIDDYVLTTLGRETGDTATTYRLRVNPVCAACGDAPGTTHTTGRGRVCSGCDAD